MLSYEDQPTIRHAIINRIGKEPGVKIADLRVVKHDDCIGVGVYTVIQHPVTLDILGIKSFFDLPPQFDYRQLHDEIDEVAEEIKQARKETFGAHGLYLAQKRGRIEGNGLRGNWRKYAQGNPARQKDN